MRLKPFFLLLIPAMLTAFIGVYVVLWLAVEGTQTGAFDPLWWEQRAIATSGIERYFNIFLWAFKYFGERPVHAIVGILLIWWKVIAFLVGIGLAADWAGRPNSKPTE